MSHSAPMYVPLPPDDVYPYPFVCPPKASSQVDTHAEQRPKTKPGFQLKTKSHPSPDEHARMADFSRVPLGGSSRAHSALSREPPGLGLPGQRSEEERAELGQELDEEPDERMREAGAEAEGEEAGAEAEGSGQADSLLGFQPRYEVHSDWFAPGRRLAPDALSYTWPEFLDWYGEKATERWENAPPDPVAQQNYRRLVMVAIHNRELLRMGMQLTRDTDRLKEQTRRPLPWVFGPTLPDALLHADAETA